MRSVILIALALTGCAPRLSFANETGGVINKSGSLGNDRAYAMMTEHCKKFDKIPRVSSRDILTNAVRFDCVAP